MGLTKMIRGTRMKIVNQNDFLVYLLFEAPESGLPFRGFFMPFFRSGDAPESVSRPLKGFLNAILPWGVGVGIFSPDLRELGPTAGALQPPPANIIFCPSQDTAALGANTGYILRIHNAGTSFSFAIILIFLF